MITFPRITIQLPQTSYSSPHTSNDHFVEKITKNWHQLTRHLNLDEIAKDSPLANNHFNQELQSEHDIFLTNLITQMYISRIPQRIFNLSALSCKIHQWSIAYDTLDKRLSTENRTLNPEDIIFLAGFEGIQRRINLKIPFIPPVETWQTTYPCTPGQNLIDRSKHRFGINPIKTEPKLILQERIFRIMIRAITNPWRTFYLDKNKIYNTYVKYVELVFAAQQREAEFPS